MIKLDKAIAAAEAGFNDRLYAVSESLRRIHEDYGGKGSIAAIQERVEELADAAMEALRWADRCAELEKLRDQKS